MRAPSRPWSVVAAGCVAALVLAGCGTAAEPTTGDEPLPPGTSTSAAPQPSATGTPTPDAAAPSDPVLLWPFRDRAAAQAWQREFRAGGAQPWHLDSEATALGFTQGHLGYGGLDRVTSREGGDAEAWIGVGYSTGPGGRDATAAVLHLVRIGTEEDAPWGVVGTRDTSLTLTSPAYRAPLQWPLTTGGVITGVDESLRVRVLGPDGTVVGQSCCTPAGGEKRPWSVAVPDPAGQAPQGDLTVVVETGGHIVDVELFAITVVRG